MRLTYQHWIFYMKTLDLTGFLENVQDLDSIPYLLKLFLKEKIGLDVEIDPLDPLDPFDVEIKVNGRAIEHSYFVDEIGLKVKLNLENL